MHSIGANSNNNICGSNTHYQCVFNKSQMHISGGCTASQRIVGDSRSLSPASCYPLCLQLFHDPWQICLLRISVAVGATMRQQSLAWLWYIWGHGCSLIKSKNPHWSANRIFNAHNYLMALILSVLLPCPYIQPLTIDLKLHCPFQDMTILTPQHMTIPTSAACHRKLIFGFLKPNISIKSFPINELCSRDCSHPWPLCPQCSHHDFIQSHA